MNRTLRHLPIPQILLYGGLLLGALTLVVLYLMGGNEVFDKKETVKYTYVDEVVLPMHNVRTLNPAAGTDEDTYHISRLVYDSLFVTDETMTPVADLAAEYAFDGDNRTITVTLVNTTWHDGKPLTPEDVVFSLNAHKRQGRGGMYHDMVEGIDYAEAVDGKVVIHFLEAHDMALDMLQWPILPAHGFDGTKDAVQPRAGFVPVGTGAYRVESYEIGGNLVLVPNENYHGTKAKNKLIFDGTAYKGDAYQLLQSGGVGLLVTGDEERASHITKKAIHMTDFPANRVDYLCFNCNGTFTSKKIIRQGICHAMDCSEYIGLHLDCGMVNDNVFFPGYLGVESGQDPYPFDLKQAAACFEEAGFGEANEEGYLQDEEGTVLRIDILVPQGDATKKTAADELAGHLLDAGVRAEVDVVDGDTYRARMSSGDYDLCFGSYTFDNTMDMRALLGDDATNYSGYAKKDVKKALDELRSGKTPEEMTEIYTGIHDRLVEDVPYYCVMYRTLGVLQAGSFDGKVAPVWNNYYHGADGWRSKYTEKDT